MNDRKGDFTQLILSAKPLEKARNEFKVSVLQHIVTKLPPDVHESRERSLGALTATKEETEEEDDGARPHTARVKVA